MLIAINTLITQVNISTFKALVTLKTDRHCLSEIALAKNLLTREMAVQEKKNIIKLYINVCIFRGFICMNDRTFV